ncbi:MAG: hypothetical protein QNJ36_13290 [Calothrix sp. MO_167.B42]|nr:hypothetical protein [Calothrix sp. MO_167.B42]
MIGANRKNKTHINNILSLSNKASRSGLLLSGLTLLLGVSSSFSPSAYAEGSRDMFPSGAQGNRGHILWQNGTTSNGGFKERTLLRVYAEKDQYILVGSSAVGVGSGNILIYNPNTVTGGSARENLPSTANFNCVSQQSGRGFISSRTQELAGPKSIDDQENTNGYTPCYYQAPETGIYYIAMYGPSGGNSNASPNNGVQPNIEQINTGSNQNTGISAWDVTVRSSNQSSTTDITGRLFTFYIDMNMGNNGRQLHSDIFVITIDGFRYKLDMRGLDPFGFRIFGNLLGNLDSDGKTPLYRNILGSNGNIDNPEGGVSTAPPQFPMFFNTLDPTALPYITRYDPDGQPVGTGIAITPTRPGVSNANFTGSVTGKTTLVNTGGTFTFNSNAPGTYQIIISRDGVNFDPTHNQNRVLRGVMNVGGSQSVTWNGKDNTADPFPVGNYPYKIITKGGEYHFPISDAENNFSGGPTITLLNEANPLGNSTAFYDDRGYVTVGGTTVGTLNQPLCGTNPPNPAFSDPINGFDSSTNDRAFGTTSGGNTNNKCTGSFGDTKTLDMWTYFPSGEQSESLNIIDTDDITPTMVLVKRITAINTTQYTDVLDGVDDSNSPNYVPSPHDIDDNNSNWLSNYLQGRINAGEVSPGDEVEYTIYFLSAGFNTANNVLMCDFVPTNTTFISTTFGTDKGIFLSYNGSTVSLTNTQDGDAGQYFPPGVEPSTVYPNIDCDGDPNINTANTNGAVVVNLGNLPHATAPGAPANSYGFVRFRAKID